MPDVTKLQTKEAKDGGVASNSDGVWIKQRANDVSTNPA